MQSFSQVLLHCDVVSIDFTFVELSQSLCIRMCLTTFHNFQVVMYLGVVPLDLLVSCCFVEMFSHSVFV